MERRICIVGLGYVGLPLAIAFGKKSTVVGFDVNTARIERLKEGIDWNEDVASEDLKEANIHFTDDSKDIEECDFIIVAVPTPVTPDHKPDLTILEAASKLVGKHLQKGSIVVFESTVYPGITEEVCTPMLEEASGLMCGTDFKVGYSPERINPGDKEHVLTRIVKIVAGMDKESLDTIASVYESIITAGVHRTSSIKVAEAAKVIENTQRDINIALMNEFQMIFDKMEIDTLEVLKAAGTKWNFLKFTPGLVGGHCIGVDPYYLAYRAKQLGHHPQMILAGREINDGMATYVANRVAQRLREEGYANGKLLVLGATFKPNVKDLRNSKVEQLIAGLEQEGYEVAIHDPLVDQKELFGKKNLGLDEARDAGYEHALLAVRHDALKDVKGFKIHKLF